MAYVSAKDITAVTWDSKAHLAFVNTITGLKKTAVLQERTPPGSTSPVPIDTGYRQYDPITIEYLYDAGASPTPNADITIGASATLLITLGTNQSITGTCVVESIEITVGSPNTNLMTVVFRPSGALTWDLLAAA